MRVYESSKIRNISILGHSSSGKSNLSEAFLYTAGRSSRISSPTDPVKITSSLGVFNIEWNDMKYNFLDTPGYFDFEGEVMSSLRAAYSSIVVVDSTTSLQVGTYKALELTEDLSKPRFIFVNKIDSEKADYNKIIQQLSNKFGKKIAPFHVPWGEADNFKGFINVVDYVAREYNGKECVDADMPEDMVKKITPIRQMLLESVAESDEELLEKYFEGEEFTKEEIKRGLRAGVLSGDIIPVLCGSTSKNIGIHTLLDMIGAYMPSPADQGLSKDKDFKGIIFKTVSDPFVGKISYVKIESGQITPDSELYNLNKDTKEKISKIFHINYDKLDEIDSAVAGDIIAITKLQESTTSDTLSSNPKDTPFEKINFPRPQMLVAIEPINKGDEEKISSGLQKLSEEDPTFTFERNAETRQTVVGVQGDIHINSLKDKLKDKFGVEITIQDLKVPYRETIRSKSDVQGKHKKQSGGHGQYGDVKIRFEPSDEEFEFAEEIFGGSVPKSYIPAVEKGLIESMEKGVLAGFPVTNIKATLYDGSYHDVDSSEMAFKLAASLAFKKGMQEANPVLLEPVMSLKIVVPDENTGDIMGDITKKRGRVLGMQAYKNGKQLISAEAPEAEIFKYAIDLKAMTQGMGFFEMDFARYEQVPEQMVEKIIKEQSEKNSDK